MVAGSGQLLLDRSLQSLALTVNDQSHKMRHYFWDHGTFTADHAADQFALAPLTSNEVWDAIGWQQIWVANQERVPGCFTQLYPFTYSILLGLNGMDRMPSPTLDPHITLYCSRAIQLCIISDANHKWHDTLWFIEMDKVYSFLVNPRVGVCTHQKWHCSVNMTLNR